METARDRAQDRRRLAAPPGRAGSTEGSFASLFEVVVGLDQATEHLGRGLERACASGSDTFAMSARACRMAWLIMSLIFAV
jgi:hypothetical protein